MSASLKQHFFRALFLLLSIVPHVSFADSREIQEGISTALQANRELGHYEVQIDVRRGVVVLRGEVSSAEARAWIEKTALKQRGVERIDNLLVIVDRPPEQNSLAAQILERLQDSGSIQSTNLTVRTQGSDVVLLGTVPSAELSKRIEELAFSTPGVGSIRNELVVQRPFPQSEVLTKVINAVTRYHGGDVAARFDGPELVLSGDLESHRAVDELLASVVMIEGVGRIRSEITVRGAAYPR